ncbi:hypothetical protein [Nocardia pseudobrasiliensis]|uniref:Uncharacterized protein n=1 Tax=Nocardia pseudobrasiliensis TaxID=45979 RepID=A0A370ICB0_9NOCA|nr:hypothetical protein [Nocardia pseudobrasiliensis]RDI67044.1 hypothetical protein DFR76_103115 [Nocardia pseudobrasiliensis]
MAPRNLSRQGYSLALVVVIVAVVVALAVWFWPRGDDRSRAEGTGTSSNPAPASSDSAPTSKASDGDPAAAEFPYQPLWPFADAAAVNSWEVAHSEGGLQPWHLDAGVTAQYFARYYLGYESIDKVVSSSVQAREAWIGVGFDHPGGTTTAAVVHLARFGPEVDSPWEVVGTQDTTLSVTTPAYGAAVNSSLTVGGRVTGVDENLRVQVRALDRPQQPVAEAPAIPAGGTDTPWTTTVELGACSGTLTVAVATGGHVGAVERFAVTGVHC